MADITYYANLNSTTDSHDGTEVDPFSAADLQGAMIVSSANNETYNVSGSYEYTTEFAFKNKTGEITFQSWLKKDPARIKTPTMNFLNSGSMSLFTMKNIIMQRTGTALYFSFDLTTPFCQQYYENVIFIGSKVCSSPTAVIYAGISDIKFCNVINPSTSNVIYLIKSPDASVNLTINSCYFDGYASGIFGTSTAGSYKYCSFYNNGPSFTGITPTLPDGGNNQDKHGSASLLNGPIYDIITDNKSVYLPNSFTNSYTGDPVITGGLDIFGLTRRAVPGVGASEYPTGTLTNLYYTDLSIVTDGHAGTELDKFSPSDFQTQLATLSVDNETHIVSGSYDYTTTFQIKDKSGSISIKSSSSDAVKIRMPHGVGATNIVSSCTGNISLYNIMMQINNAATSAYGYNFAEIYPAVLSLYNSTLICSSEPTQFFMIVPNINFVFSQFINPSSTTLEGIILYSDANCSQIIDSCYFDGYCQRPIIGTSKGYYRYSSFYNHGGSFIELSYALPDGGNNQDYHASSSLLNGPVSNIITDLNSVYQPKTLAESQTANPILLGGVDIFGTIRRDPPGVGSVEYPITYVTPVLLSFDSSRIRMLYQDKLTYDSTDQIFISNTYNKIYTDLVDKVSDPVDFARGSKLFMELKSTTPYNIISDKGNTLLVEVEAYYDDENETIVFNKISDFYGDLFNKILEDGKYIFIFDESLNLLKIYNSYTYDKGLSGNRNIVNNIRFGGPSVI